MSEKKIIAVVGSTGAQGSGLVRAIADDPAGGFSARGLTRDPHSGKAQGLKRPGVEFVGADVDDPETLERAFAGAYGAFCVTFFWDHMVPEREFQEAEFMAEAAGKTGVRHLIWSTLEDTRNFVPLSDERMPTLHGKYKVPHLDGKGEADKVFTELALPVTFLLTSFYWENFIHFGMGPRRGPDGKLVLALPMGKARLSGIAAEDIGKCAYGIFKRPGLIGKRVGIAGEHLTGDEMAAAMSRAFGEEVRYEPMSPPAYRGLGFPGADDLGNMFQFYQEFAADFARARSLETSRELNPQLQDFETWLSRNKDQIPLG